MRIVLSLDPGTLWWVAGAFGLHLLYLGIRAAFTYAWQSAPGPKERDRERLATAQRQALTIVKGQRDGEAKAD